MRLRRGCDLVCRLGNSALALAIISLVYSIVYKIPPIVYLYFGIPLFLLWCYSGVWLEKHCKQRLCLDWFLIRRDNDEC